jgi:hypothetical protein
MKSWLMKTIDILYCQRACSVMINSISWILLPTYELFIPWISSIESTLFIIITNWIVINTSLNHPST